MHVYDIIAKKRDGGELSRGEIDFLVQGFTDGSVKDYQMSAWAMAVFLRGMTPEETAGLTLAMVGSGDTADLSPIKGRKVDKHSTGGVGDKTTLVLAPLVAAAGVNVAKMSGRGLGHTGGTLDKLEAIPGFSIELSREKFVSNVNNIKVAIVGQTGNLVPADKKLYALRDVTATVDCIPLIASSVMSKKIAAGADAIVLDVKTGSGAFMKTVEESFELARAMVEIGELTGRQTVALVTDMDQPLGCTIGNALEVKEAIVTLQGKGPEDLTELCLALGSEMLVLSGQYPSTVDARKTLLEVIRSGRALDKFRELIKAQGGDVGVIDHPEILPEAKHILPVLAERDGVVARIKAEEIGRCAMNLGAGRETKESSIDLGVGLVLCKKRGDGVKAGEVLAYIHANDLQQVDAVSSAVQAAYSISDEPQSALPLVYGRVSKQGTERLHL